MNAVDTNLLIYAHDPRDPAKQSTALGLIESLTDGALLWQVACEYLSASRKLQTYGFSRDQAWREIERLRLLWTAVYPTWETLARARLLGERYSLSFWDSMIVAACDSGGVRRLYTEDFDAYEKVGSVEVVNPFR